MKKAELVFIPSPGLSHLVPTVETAKLLLHRHRRLSATVLLIPKPFKDAKMEIYISHLITSSRLKFINLPQLEKLNSLAPATPHFFDYIDNQTNNVRNAVSDLMKRFSSESQVAGLVLDIFCLKFIDVAGEFGLPSYLFFTAAACNLGLFQHLFSLKKEDLMQFRNSDVELAVSCFSAPVPAKVLPAMFVDERVKPDIFLNHFKRLSEVRGVMVNTFYELESYAIESLLSDRKMPDIFPVGPVLELTGGDEDVEKWLDKQHEKSVVFLCFGTMGSLTEAQVREISLALENSGCRFLWSLRDGGAVPPDGFLERTKCVGKVIGWASQAAALGHAAVGGFVSHCGWTSILESVWFGVPIATFPLYAEQRLNAFYLVEEVRMAEAITPGFAASEIVEAEEIAAAIKRVMAAEGVRRKVEMMQKKARAAMMEGGSSYNAQSLFIEDVFRNINCIDIS